MKKIALIYCILLTSSMVFCQEKQNPINIIRYNDDFSALRKDSVKSGFNKLKYIQIAKNTNISFGGELREQFQYIDNLNFGDVPPTYKQSTVGFLWQRIMVHSNMEIGSKIRVFVQFNSTFRFLNPNPLIPEIDENQLSLHQAFIDYKINNNWIARIGRQEMSYGNSRLISLREGPNTRLTFDGVILKYKTNKRKIDFLFTTPVISMPKVFDDKSFLDYIFGMYGTEYNIHNKFGIEYYFLNFISERRKYNYVSGQENRQTFGFRIFNQIRRVNYELEGTYQIGKFNDLKIAAYGASMDIDYNIYKKLNFRIGVGANYFSGDRNKGDNELNTYNIILSKPSYGIALPIGNSNVVNLNPYIKINPIKKLSIFATIYFLQRASSQDGTYSPLMTQIRPTTANLFASAKKEIGKQFALETNYNFNNNISFSIDAVYFKPGDYPKETGKGLALSYLSLKGTFKF